MSLEKSRSRAQRTSIDTEEARAWVGFYRRVGHDPAIAAEVITELAADPEMKRAHLALYLCCRESLRRHEARETRNKRIGQFVRGLCHSLFIRPVVTLQQRLRNGRDMAVECLPEVADPRAAAQVRRLPRKTAGTATRPASDQRPTPADPAPATAEGPAPPDVKVPLRAT
ncbi:hypothetical protein E6C76_21015 [Pseudothauera nasutitermitis]|uniref:Uncharacterized protein n=1 Tax=Pseudothauera nasutitermitis TaxID=2565930 RepID=A0A4S4AP94_9RHOO|nr:hypothetical protein [Pseudothauera nasutitermitis]THF61077.1 hypothetical protein E6C76_21015 [Pseudothauera nasutitermitis]